MNKAQWKAERKRTSSSAFPAREPHHPAPSPPTACPTRRPFRPPWECKQLPTFLTEEKKRIKVQHTGAGGGGKKEFLKKIVWNKKWKCENWVQCMSSARSTNLCLHMEVYLTANGQGALHTFRRILHRRFGVSNHQVIHRREKRLGRDRVLQGDDGRLHVAIRDFHQLRSLFCGCLGI